MLVLSLLLALGAASCGDGDGGDGDGDDAETVVTGEDDRRSEAQPGGTLRIETDAFDWTANFDPTGEYLPMYFGIYNNLLGRTLMGYRHVPGAAGNEVIPDLAVSEPEISEDGTTYTFRLRDGVMFGPPVEREVTSEDVLYAFKRIGTEPLFAQYGFYYEGLIEGLREFKEAGGLREEGNEISGIETPDEQTIVFHLTRPAGDFVHMLAMPAAGPIPEEVASCFMRAGDYGRFLISSGPYMIEGSDELDASSCDAMKPLSGFSPNRHLTLVRNPIYDPETDSEDARENFFDEWEMTLNTNPQDIFDRVENGQLDLAYTSELPEVLDEYSTNEDLRDRYKRGARDWTWYVTMNLTQPPFDDVHVRKAMNWIMDKDGLRRAWGGESKGDIAQHIVPDAMFDDRLSDYAPYQTEGDAGDLEKAMEEMRESKYDTDQDGICDVQECKNVLHVTRNTEVWKNMAPVIEESARKIGIELTTREYDDSYSVIMAVKSQVPISSTPGWGKDYADPSTFMVLFDSRIIRADGNVNYSLVGLTPEQAVQTGVEGMTEEIPSVDEDIDRCLELYDEERMDCWIDLDRKLMEEVVPWVPYLDQYAEFVVGEAVTKWEFDQSSGGPGWAHIAVDESRQ